MGTAQTKRKAQGTGTNVSRPSVGPSRLSWSSVPPLPRRSAALRSDSEAQTTATILRGMEALPFARGLLWSGRGSLCPPADCGGRVQRPPPSAVTSLHTRGRGPSGLLSGGCARVWRRSSRALEVSSWGPPMPGLQRSTRPGGGSGAGGPTRCWLPPPSSPPLSPSRLPIPRQPAFLLPQSPSHPYPPSPGSGFRV